MADARPRLEPRTALRGLWLLLRVAYRSSPLVAVGALVLAPMAEVQGVLAALWLKLVGDGVFAGDEAKATTGAVLLAASAGMFAFSTLGSAKLRLTLTERSGHALDRDLAARMASIPVLEHHERAEYLDRLSLLREQGSNLLSQGANMLVVVLMFSVQVVASFLLLGRLSPWFALLVLGALPGLWLVPVQQRRMRRFEEQTAPAGRRHDRLYQLATTAAPGKEVRVFGLEADLLDRFARSTGEVHGRRRSLAIRHAAESLLSLGVPAIAVAAAVAFTAVRAARGVYTPGDVLLVATISGQVTQGITQLMGLSAAILQVLRTVERYLWLVDFADRVAGGERRVAAPPDRLADGIRLDGVSFTYPGTGEEILHAVDLHLPAGGVVALVGENGAGKTTLVKLLCRLYDPTSGRIILDGTDLADIGYADWRRRVTAAFQDFAKLELTMGETVGVGDLPRLGDEQAVRTGLERAGASDVPGGFDLGLATQLGRDWEGGVELSVGQWQKLALGRALVRDEPLLLVLDEPTSALDAETEHALFERFAAVNRSNPAGAVTVLVSHRFSTVRMADLIVVLEGGRVVERGSHAQLMVEGGLYAELFSLQARSYR